MRLTETAGCSLCGLSWGNCQCALRPKSATGSRSLDSVVSLQSVRACIEEIATELQIEAGDLTAEIINDALFSAKIPLVVEDYGDTGSPLDQNITVSVDKKSKFFAG